MQSKKEASVGTVPPGEAGPSEVGDEHYQTAQHVLTSYLRERCQVFRRLSDLQAQGWKSAEGDEFFRKQRERADQRSEETQEFFFKMMGDIGREMHRTVGAFDINPPNNAQPRILDMCVAPGGFLAAALEVHPRAEAVGFTLPVAAGGYKVLMRASDRVQLTYVDITMLAGDLGLGADDVPRDHPERDQFVLERRLPAPAADAGDFDLALCDGQVLRTHARAAYREAREARRLGSAQLALALARLRPGGTLVVLLQKPGAWDTATLLWQMSRFAAEIRLFKPRPAHAKRSSFYLVAAGVQARRPEARAAVRRWERVWRAATFGTDAEYADARREGEPGAEALLAEFGPRLIELAAPVWEIQARALAKAPFMKQR